MKAYPFNLFSIKYDFINTKKFIKLANGGCLQSPKHEIEQNASKITL